MGAPDAAAVVAAPIRNECVDIGSVIGDGNARLRSVLSLLLEVGTIAEHEQQASV